MQVQFVGAARTVTGSRHLVRTEHATILLDCGLFQGRRRESRQHNMQLGFEPGAIDAVVLSHAHIDHSGALPMLCKQGYSGPIYATAATRDLCAVMLSDAAMIQAADARYLNRAEERRGSGVEPITALYDETDVARTLSQILTLPYQRRQRIAKGVWLTFVDAGHVLGSAVVVLDVDEVGQDKRLVFTGDLGRAGMPILRDPVVPSRADALICEGTYGDRLHPPVSELEDELARVIERTHRRRGRVIIPSFALERAQHIVYSLKRLRDQNRIPTLPVYVDSPLTVNITEVFRMHSDCYDREARAALRGNSSPFDFPGLRYVMAVEDSKAITNSDEPCVIISASGMCEAGRVLHHLKASVEDPKNTVLIVGFQAEHTLGRRIVERRPRIRILGEERQLAAEVVVMNGFSAHADRAGLLEFIEAARERGPLRKVALVHGEPPALEALRQQLEERSFPSVIVPGPSDSWQI